MRGGFAFFPHELGQEEVANPVFIAGAVMTGRFKQHVSCHCHILCQGTSAAASAPADLCYPVLLLVLSCKYLGCGRVCNCTSGAGESNPQCSRWPELCAHTEASNRFLAESNFWGVFQLLSCAHMVHVSTDLGNHLLCNTCSY